MTLLFKLLGFALIILTCSSAGFLKANRLNLRAKKLYSLQKGVAQLKELIRLRGGEIDRLIVQSFESYPIDYSHLEVSDCEITDSLFSEIGMLDTQSAYNRCELCLSLLQNKYDEAQKSCRELGKLYKSIGALAGIFICIFLI